MIGQGRVLSGCANREELPQSNFCRLPVVSLGCREDQAPVCRYDGSADYRYRMALSQIEKASTATQISQPQSCPNENRSCNKHGYSHFK
jgi:hypothetical protein